jgi:hypothetical protein
MVLVLVLWGTLAASKCLLDAARPYKYSPNQTIISHIPQARPKIQTT